MGKRAATKAAAGKPAKVARDSRLDEVLSSLAADPSLCAALPFALQTAPGERHKFQNIVIDAATTALAKVRQAQQADVDACQQALEDEAAEFAKLSSALTAAEELVQAREKNKLEVEGEVAAAESALDRTGQEVQAAKDEKARIEEEGRTSAKLQTEMASVVTMFTALKEYKFENWRERNKEITKVSQVLRQAGFSESLIAAVAAAFKIKPDERGPFGITTMAAAEAEMQQTSAKLAAAESATACEVAGQEALIAQAIERDQQARSARDAVQDRLVEAENNWAASTEGALEAKQRLRKFDAEKQERVDNASAARESLESVVAVLEMFEQLKSGAKEPVSEEAAPAAPEVE